MPTAAAPAAVLAEAEEVARVVEEAVLAAQDEAVQQPEEATISTMKI